MDGYGAEAPAVSGDDSFVNDFSAERASDDHLDNVIAASSTGRRKRPTGNRASAMSETPRSRAATRPRIRSSSRPSMPHRSAPTGVQTASSVPRTIWPADETARPTETPATERAEFERWAQDDREFIAKQPPEVQEWVNRKKEEYASVDAFGAKWAPYLGQIGIPPSR